MVVYGQAITSFSRWLEAQGREATVDEMTRAAIREWLAHLSDINEASTVKTRYCGLFRFCSWLVDEDEIPKNPMKTLSPPRPKMKPVPILSDGDLAALLKACQGEEFRNRSDEAMIRLLLDCGLRVSELCGLTAEGIDLDNGMAMVRGNGIPRCADAHPARGAVTRRRPGADERAGCKAGLDHLHPHQFRHTFAHDFLMNGATGARPETARRMVFRCDARTVWR